jgi:hypothetical protein
MTKARIEGILIFACKGDTCSVQHSHVDASFLITFWTDIASSNTIPTGGFVVQRNTLIHIFPYQMSKKNFPFLPFFSSL